MKFFNLSNINLVNSQFYKPNFQSSDWFNPFSSSETTENWRIHFVRYSVLRVGTHCANRVKSIERIFFSHSLVDVNAQFPLQFADFFLIRFQSSFLVPFISLQTHANLFNFCSSNQFGRKKKICRTKMACPIALASERVWVDKHQYVEAERKLHSKVNSHAFRPLINRILR